MNKISVLMFIVLFSPLAMAKECEPDSFNIFYIPIDVEFYVPPTREDIMRLGDNFEMDSCVLSDLFIKISNQDGVEPQSEDYKSLRILIIRKSDGREVFITVEKRVLSEDKIYNIDVKIIDNVINEIVDNLPENRYW
jgi:hypothetical protein